VQVIKQLDVRTQQISALWVRAALTISARSFKDNQHTFRVHSQMEGIWDAPPAPLLTQPTVHGYCLGKKQSGDKTWLSIHFARNAGPFSDNHWLNGFISAFCLRTVYQHSLGC